MGRGYERDEAQVEQHLVVSKGLIETVGDEGAQVVNDGRFDESEGRAKEQQGNQVESVARARRARRGTGALYQPTAVRALLPS